MKSRTHTHGHPVAIPLTVIMLLLSACTGSPKRDPRAIMPEPQVRQDSGTVVMVDKDETIWPNPVERTYVRMSTLRNLLNDYEARTGVLPDELTALSSSGTLLPDESARDGWGNPIVLFRTGTDYELRAAGPDRIAGSADDLVLRRTEEMPVVARDPGATTHTRLKSLQLLISVYRYRTGEFPDDIRALERAGLRPFLGVVDAWGNPIRYFPPGSDVELRSAGPDGEMGTSDDLVLVGLVTIPQH